MEPLRAQVDPDEVDRRLPPGQRAEELAGAAADRQFQGRSFSNRLGEAIGGSAPGSW
jgi:hypothetical protein